MQICKFQIILNDFAKLVGQKLYKPVNYQNWRTLVKIGDKCEIYYNKPYIELFNSGNDDSILIFSINDVSFGAYLYGRYFAGIEAPVETDENKENENMFNKFNFGPVTDGSVRFSPYGMSICNIDGKWVSYNAHQNQIIETEGFTFEMDNMIYKIPVATKDVRPGDMIIHNDTYVYVLSNENGNIKVVNISAGDQRTILPPSNMFGFNFVTKVVSMLDMAGLGCGTRPWISPSATSCPCL